MTTRKPKLRLLSALLAVAMMLTLLPTAAFAEEPTTNNTELTVTVQEGQSLKEAVETAKPNDWKDITKLTVITAAGKELDKDDFQFMSGVVVDTSTLRGSAKAVNPGTGYASEKYTGEEFDCLTKLLVLDLTDATCKDNAIPMRAFQRNGNITTIYLPTNLERTYIHAFSMMENLTYIGTKAGNLVFPDTMKIMGEGMLYKDSGIVGTLTFPASLKAIGAACFQETGIKGDVVLPDGVDIETNTDVDNNGEYQPSAFTFYKTAISSLTFGEGTNRIGSSFAYGCTQLTQVTLSSTISTIGASAFQGTALEKLPDLSHVTNIEASAFRNITNDGFESDLVLPKGVIYGDSVFRGDHFKGNVTINSDTIGNYLFMGHTNDKGTVIQRTEIDGNVTINTDTLSGGMLRYADIGGDITVNGNILSTSTLQDSNVNGKIVLGCANVPNNFMGVSDANYDGTDRLSGANRLVLNAGITKIGNSAFCGAGLTGTLTLPEGLEEIGDSAFRHNNFSGVIVIPKSVTKIGAAAFSYVGGGASSEAHSYTGDTNKKINAIVVGNPDIELSKWAFANQKDGIQLYFASQRAATTLKGADGIDYWSSANAIALNTNGGEVNTNLIYIKTGLYVVNKTGYTFDGRYTDPTFADESTKLADTAEKGKTYHAKWSINHYTVQFVNDGEDAGTVNDVEYNTTISADNAPEVSTKEGYTFDGWYNGDEKFVFGETKVTGDTTLTAKWNINKYNVNFVVDGKTENTQKVEHGEVVKAPELTKTGYTFDGWYKDKACKGEKFDFATAIKENTTLYAKWNIDHYNVTFVNDGAEAGKVEDVEYNATISADNAPETPTKAGYTFDGWYNGNEKFVFGENGTKVTSNLTLTAKWTEVKKPDPTPGDDKPTTPEEPSKPEQPGDDKPTTPTKPEEPAKPGEDKPSTPETPAEPSTPEEPSKPEEPKPVTYTISIDNGKAYLDDGETEINTAKEGQKVIVKVNPEAITDGFEFDKWEVVSGEVMLDDEASPETSFEMPASDVELKATVKAVEPAVAPLTKLEQAAVVSTGAVVAGAGVAAVGFAAYGIGTELTARLMLPAGAAMPTTCGELSKVLWKNVGCQALPADVPLSEDELILNWAIDNDLMDEDSTLEKHVSAVTVIKALSAEKKLTK